MKITTGLLAGVAMLAIAQTAQAAPPKVSGKYALMSFTQCQAQFTTTEGNYRRANGSTGPAVTTVNPAQNGEINIAVGTMKFPNTAASSGNATLEMSIVAGASLKINTSGGAIGTHTETASGPYQITLDTFTFEPTDGPPMIWTMRAGDIVSGVARTLYMTRKENARCISAITATKQ